MTSKILEIDGNQEYAAEIDNTDNAIHMCTILFSFNKNYLF